MKKSEEFNRIQQALSNEYTLMREYRADMADELRKAVHGLRNLAQDFSPEDFAKLQAYILHIADVAQRIDKDTRIFGDEAKLWFHGRLLGLEEH